MDAKEVFHRLSRVEGVSRVVSRDRRLDKIIVNDPWVVANPTWMQASRWLLGIAIGLVLIALFIVHLRGFALGSASLLVTLAMLVRLHAPAASGLATWNDFAILGDTDDFPLQGTVEAPDAEDRSGPNRDGIAAAFAFATADSIQDGFRTYSRARMALLGAEMLRDLPSTPHGFFAGCVAVGSACVALMIMMLGVAEFERWMILFGPFCFFSAAILQAVVAPKWLRGRIMPYRGLLVMHQHRHLNGIMATKVLLGLLASSLLPVHVWCIMTAARYAVLGHDEYDQKILRKYPTPVPRTEFALLVLPFSIGAGLAVLANYGQPTPLWLFVLVFLVPGLLGLTSMVFGPSTDILKHLSQQGSLDSSSKLDAVLDRLFALHPNWLPDRLLEPRRDKAQVR
jgi:hypothetical protein